MRVVAAARRPGETGYGPHVARTGEQPGSQFISPTIGQAGNPLPGQSRGQLPGPHGASSFAISAQANPQTSLSSFAAPAVHYHIERLVLDGVPLSAQQKQVLAAALEQELGSLLQRAHASPHAVDLLHQATSGALARLQAAPVSFGQPCDARDLGQQIARAIHASVQGSGHLPPESLFRSTKP